jgi:hypothetical protein
MMSVSAREEASRAFLLFLWSLALLGLLFTIGAQERRVSAALWRTAFCLGLVVLVMALLRVLIVL